MCRYVVLSCKRTPSVTSSRLIKFTCSGKCRPTNFGSTPSSYAKNIVFSWFQGNDKNRVARTFDFSSRWCCITPICRLQSDTFTLRILYMPFFNCIFEVTRINIPLNTNKSITSFLKIYAWRFRGFYCTCPLCNNR